MSHQLDFTMNQEERIAFADEVWAECRKLLPKETEQSLKVMGSKAEPFSKNLLNGSRLRLQPAKKVPKELWKGWRWYEIVTGTKGGSSQIVEAAFIFGAHHLKDGTWAPYAEKAWQIMQNAKLELGKNFTLNPPDRGSTMAVLARYSVDVSSAQVAQDWASLFKVTLHKLQTL